jgi:CheY-like chemotaxis protein
MRILVAEDESLVAQLIARVLEGAGDHVEIVASSVDALARLAAQPFDLLLLDLRLRDGDGFRVVDSIDMGTLPPLPVLLITGDQFDDDDPRPARVARILTKPFDVRELEQAVALFRP